MKATIAILILSLGIMISSCKKATIANVTDDTPGTIVGNWNVVTDSTIFSASEFHAADTIVHIGVPADHYLFTSTDSVAIVDGSKIGSAEYSLPAADSVTFMITNEWGVPLVEPDYASFYIAVLTAHHMVLTSRPLYPILESTPEGGTVSEVISLEKN